MRVFESSSFYWAIGTALALPIVLIALTELHHGLLRRQSHLTKLVAALRDYLLPLGALYLLVVEAGHVPARETPVRILATVVGFVVLVLLLSGVNAVLFQTAPRGSWRGKLPGIFIDVGRLLLISVGLAVIFSYIWGVRIGGLFTALGVTSVVIGLMLQNSVGQIVSGLFMLIEQPFRIGDWVDTPSARGRVVEANWRAVHINTGKGLQIIPNSVLAATSFTNLSHPQNQHKLAITTTFSVCDPPDRVCAMLCRVASALPLRDNGFTPTAVTTGDGEYRTTVGLKSPADDGAAQTTFLRWVWYAARRDELHLDGADDDFCTPARIERAVRTVVAPALRLRNTEEKLLLPEAKIVRYGADEVVQYAGEVPSRITFLISGSVQLITTAADGSLAPVSVLQEGAFLGVNTLTRQPNLSGACALDEVTALEIDREHLEHLVMRKPLLLQELGRILDERRKNTSRVEHREQANRAVSSG